MAAGGSCIIAGFWIVTGLASSSASLESSERRGRLVSGMGLLSPWSGIGGRWTLLSRARASVAVEQTLRGKKRR